MNETAQHTPGPWRTVPTAAKAAGIYRLDVVTDALPFAPSFVAGDILSDDAHLIAAAPDLLAAAKLAFSALNASGTWTDATASAFTALGLAIRKAEGRA